MFNDYPTTIEEARTKHFNTWAGNPNGWKYKEGKCAADVWNMHLSYQCSRTAKCGPGNLYCKTHAKYAERAQARSVQKVSNQI